MSDAAGELFQIEGFRIMEEIGRGAGSRVFRAVQLGVDRVVALKVVPCASRVTAERLAREARISGGQDHPGLVRVHAAGAAPGVCWLAMEFICGESLQQRMERGPLPWTEVLDLLTPVLEGLASLHSQGVVHRDLKPANILVDKQGHARLSDFGLARAAEDARLTVESGTLGTPLYMAPEQANAPAAVDARADVFSAAVTIHALLCGRSPFEAGSIAAVIARVLTEPLPPLESAHAVPRGLDPLLARAASKTPAARPADAAELLSRLQALGKVAAPHRQRRWRWAAGAASCFGLALLFWAVTGRDTDVPIHVATAPQLVAVPLADAIVSEVPPAAAVERSSDAAVNALPAAAVANVAAAEAARGAKLLVALAACCAPATAAALTRAEAEEIVAACVSDHGCEHLQDSLLRMSVATARQRAVERLLQAATDAWEAALYAVGTMRTAGDFAAAALGLNAAEAQFAAKIPGATQRIRQLLEELEHDERTRNQCLDAALASVEMLLARRAEESVLVEPRAALHAALTALPQLPLHPDVQGLNEQAARELVQALTTLPTLQALALARTATSVGAQYPLRLRGEPGRGQRVLLELLESACEFERSEDKQKTRVAWADLDASTQVALAGLDRDAAAPLLLLLGRLAVGDASSIWESLQQPSTNTLRLAAAWRRVRREGLATENELAAADALAEAAAAMGRGDCAAAVQHAQKVNSLRTKAASRAGPAWPALLREARAIDEQCAPIAERMARWRASGWTPQIDWDARILRAVLASQESALTLPASALIRETGWDLQPAQDATGGIEVRLPEGELSLWCDTPGFSGVLMGSWGSESFVIVGVSSDARGAKGEALHGIERGIARTVQVHRAVAYRGPLQAWAQAWPQAVPFRMPVTPQWQFARLANGKRQVSCGTALLDLDGARPDAATAAAPLKLQAPQSLRLGHLRLTAPLDLRR